MVTKHIDLNKTAITLNELLTETHEPTEIILMRGDQQVAQLTLTPQASPQPKKRILGLHKGQWEMSDDFTDELPDEFWLENDKANSLTS